jgi:hypothetical protein
MDPAIIGQIEFVPWRSFVPSDVDAVGRSRISIAIMDDAHEAVGVFNSEGGLTAGEGDWVVGFGDLICLPIPHEGVGMGRRCHERYRRNASQQLNRENYSLEVHLHNSFGSLYLIISQSQRPTQPLLARGSQTRHIRTPPPQGLPEKPGLNSLVFQRLR